MRRGMILGAGLAVALGGCARGLDWKTSYDEAAAEAKRTNRAILADFTGSDWCGWCWKLDEEVFSKSEFQAWAAKNVVLLQLDFPRQKTQPQALKEQNARLRDKYGVRGYPTILFLDSSGAVLGRSGYQPGGAAAWVRNAETILAEWRKSVGPLGPETSPKPER